jgi:hypothetical protein
MLPADYTEALSAIELQLDPSLTRNRVCIGLQLLSSASGDTVNTHNATEATARTGAASKARSKSEKPLAS